MISILIMMKKYKLWIWIQWWFRNQNRFIWNSCQCWRGSHWRSWYVYWWDNFHWPQMTSNELACPINFNFRFKLHCGLDRSNRKWLFHLCSIWINAGGRSYCRSSTCYMRFCARPYWKYGSYRLGFHFIDLLRIQH